MKEVSPSEAFKLMEGDPEYIYLDVRSVPEFEQGHPRGAVNVPILNFAPGMGMTPNEDFLRVVEANLPKNAKIVIGCKSGGRSARACEILSQAGYSQVANVRSGFVGTMDMMGRIVEPGWSMQNLPVCTACEKDASYEALVSKSSPK